MDQDGGAQRTTSSTTTGSSSTSSSDSSFLAEREERVRARSQARRAVDPRNAEEADQMRQIVFGTRSMSLVSNDPPRSVTSSHLLHPWQLSPYWLSPQQQMAEGGFAHASIPWWRRSHYYSQQSEEPQQAGYRNGCSYGFGRNYSMSEAHQMAEGAFGQPTSPFSPNQSSRYEGPQQMDEGGYRDAFSLNDAFLSDGRHQMAEGDYGQPTSPFNHSSSQYEGQQQIADGRVFGGASLLSPGRFGSSSDWTPPPRDYPTASRHTDHSTSIEFMPDHPPTSLSPLERPSARRGPALFVSSASYASPTATRARQLQRGAPPLWQRDQTAPQPLLQLPMQHPNGASHPAVAAAMLMPGPMVNVSCRTGRVTVTPPPSHHPFYVNPLLPPHVRAQLARDQAAPPARRARPATSSQSSSHRRNSASSNDSSMGSRGSSANATECNYCLSVRKPHYGHNKYNCPVLAELPPCPICGASGKDNHTASHCPNEGKTELTFVPKDQRRRHHTI